MEIRHKQLLIYCPNSTNRINYIFDIVLSDITDLDIVFTDIKSDFEKAQCPKFCYSPENIFPEALFLKSHPLLFEKEIRHVDIDVFENECTKAFFKTDQASFFPFDIFAASFYLITRYEEYLPFYADKYGRFDAEKSLACKESFLDIPLINIWMELFYQKLCLLFPIIQVKKTEFKYLSTIDIDNAWAHLNKGFLRTFLSLTKLLIQANFVEIIEKCKVLGHFKKDPYDNYDFLDEMNQKYGFETIYFILFSKYGQFDKNPPLKNSIFRKLIQDISKKYRVGIHPSFQSNKFYKTVKTEKSNLEEIIRKPIYESRQHFLYLKMPDTYENLLKAGIERDYSMGYSSHPGFRASFCLPYHFFNLKTDQKTLLEIVPFAVMDVCFKSYQKIKPEIALNQIKKIISSIKNVNGLFVSIWHNETLCQSKNSASWRNVFEQMMDELKNGNQILTSSRD